jgi:hypothetical protein
VAVAVAVEQTRQEFEVLAVVVVLVCSPMSAGWHYRCRRQRTPLRLGLAVLAQR